MIIYNVDKNKINRLSYYKFHLIGFFRIKILLDTVINYEKLKCVTRAPFLLQWWKDTSAVEI